MAKINGVGVALAASGIVVAAAGFLDVSLIEAFRGAAKGQFPKGNKKPFTPINWKGVAETAVDQAVTGVKGAAMIQAAASKEGQCYTFGAGHSGNPCASRCTDCSSYVSCVITRVTGKVVNLDTTGLKKIGTPVDWDSRQPGDIIIWGTFGARAHCGIILDNTRMWHNPCTGCGGVKVGAYGRVRLNTQAIIRRI